MQLLGKKIVGTGLLAIYPYGVVGRDVVSRRFSRIPMEICCAAFAMVLVHVTALTPVWAALGQPATSVERDRTLMKGQRHGQTGTGTGYSIETLTVAGMTIREFVSADGVVFAVVWKGTGAPDLSLLLGDYFEEYRDGLTTARNRTPRSRKPLALKTEHLVVEQRGHSRSMWGRAFLPSALPPGMAPEDIQ